MVLDRFFWFANRMLRIIIGSHHAQSMENGRNRLQQKRKNQHLQQNATSKNDPRCFCEAQKSKAGLAPRVSLVFRSPKPQVRVRTVYAFERDSLGERGGYQDTAVHSRGPPSRRERFQRLFGASMQSPIISQTQIKLVFLPVRDISQRPIPPKCSFIPLPTRYPTTLSGPLAGKQHISGHLAGGTHFQPDHRTATGLSSSIDHGWTQQNATMGYCRFFENAALRQLKVKPTFSYFPKI